MQNKKLTILLFLSFLFITTLSQAQPADAVISYIARYKDLAIMEMQRTGVPAAITLAQGIHETDAGMSVLVKKSNNHFGIKCKSNWTGQSVSHDDDARGECFRKYSDPMDSYKDHSDFLKGSSRYAFLFNLDPTNYEAWAYGLKKAGYATNPKYSQVLIKLIQEYNLQDYTLVALGKLKSEEVYVKNNLPLENKTEGFNTKEEEKITAVPAVEIEVNYPPAEFTINSTKVIYVKKGTSFLAIADQFNISLSKLFEFNDMKPQEIADKDQLFYIQRKRKTGTHDDHVVQPGETLFSISQTEAIRLESLLEYNHLKADMQPATGETLNLRGKASSAPRLVEKNIVPVNIESSGVKGLYALNNKNQQQQTISSEKKLFIHTVAPKETLYSIARKYNVSYDEVVSWNRLAETSLKVGQSLKIYR